MGVTVCTWAKKQTVGGPTKKVILLVLADRASDDNWSTFAGQQTIAREAEVTTRTVQRTLAEFEAMGLLERTERRRPDGYRSSDLITLNRDWDGPLPLDEGSDGEPSGDNESPDDGSPDPLSPDPLSPDEESHDNVSPCADQGVREEYQATEGQATEGQATSAPTSPDIYANSQATGCRGGELLTQSSEPSVEPKDASRFEAERLANLLAGSIAERGSKRPKVSAAWVTDMDRLIRLDGREPPDVERVIRWLADANDEIAGFWQPNIRSPKTLRAKWDQMREQYQQRRNGTRSQRTDQAWRDSQAIRDHLNGNPLDQMTGHSA